MSIDIREAEFLCTGSELQLYLQSRDPWIRQFGPGAIRRCLQRALKLSVLWQSKSDADRVQVRERRGKERLHSITGHVTARRKSELFDEVALRFSNRLNVLSEIARLGHGVPADEALEDSTDFSRP